MKFYTFIFKGYYLTGNGVTQGSTIEEAYSLAVEQMKKEELWSKNEGNFTIDDLVEISDFSKATIMFDGDY